MADEDFNTPPEETGELAEADEAVYEVRFLPERPRMGQVSVRRRGGLAFGRDRQLVSTVDHPGVQTVEPAALSKILGDKRLSVKEVEPPEVVDEGPELKGIEELKTAAPAPKKRGRPKGSGKKGR
jgi:hypothetical protein